MPNGKVANNPGGQSTQSNGFETPKVPVIFVIGGPGSGKITHSEHLARKHKGFVHVNMTELCQQIIDDTDMNDIGLVPTSKVTHTLKTQLRKRPHIYGYIVSGYPRNMRDVSDYMEKVGRCDGVILLNWHEMSLERQIEYGARMGEIDLETARVELKNFKKYVIHVAEYFDYKQLLYVVGGERKPESIYHDFSLAFEQIMNSEVKMIKPRPQSSGSYRNYRNDIVDSDDEDDDGTLGGFGKHKIPESPQTLKRRKKSGNAPFAIWIIGGPGSSKTERTREILDSHPNWHLISVGKSLWEYLEERYPEGMDENSKFYSDERQEGEEVTSNMVKNIMRKGEMVPQGLVLDLVMEEMDDYEDVEGFFICGFPRDIIQALGFEERTGLKPTCILIDCSELELGRSLGMRRGRIDDNVDAYKRRLELYRQLTLPMLKAFDEQNRLKIVDGDSDGNQVIKELKRCIHREVASLRRERAVECINENGTNGKVEEHSGYHPVDAENEIIEENKIESKTESNNNRKKKKRVRYYKDINPEVEKELQKVIDELQQREAHINLQNQEG